MAEALASRRAVGWRLVVALGCSALVAWLASPFWPGQIDDVFITLAYAWQWVEGNGLTWNTGERIEAYSNFLMVALLAAGASAGLDGALLAKWIQAASAFGLLAAFSAAVPVSARGFALVLALAVWAPFSYWAVQGMETMLFAFLLAVGWTMVLQGRGRWAVGVLLLVLAALTRPEGHAYLIAAVMVRAREGIVLRRSDAVAAAGIVALAAYHLARIAYFGSVWPAPYLVKLAAVPDPYLSWAFADLWRDLLVAGGVLIATVAVGRPRRADLPWVLVPLVVQVALFLRMSGDWMGWSRILLPGLVASSLAWTWLRAPSPSAPRWHLLLPAVVLPFGLLYNAGIDLKWREGAPLVEPWAHWTRGTDTPIGAEVQHLVENVPSGDSVLVVDIGMMGNVPDVRVIDFRGLAHGRIAREITPLEVPDGDRVARIVELVGPPDHVRLVRWDGSEPPALPDELRELYPHETLVRYPYSEARARWSARSDARPSRETVLHRWAVLHARYPSQPLVAWRHALALADAGDLETARAVVDRARARWPSLTWTAEGGLDFPYAPSDYVAGRGFPLYWNTAVTSRPYREAEAAGSALRLEADAPGEEGALAEVTWLSSCGEIAERVTVQDPAAIPVRWVPCDEEVQRVRVAFSNDRAEEGADRNLYVRLGRR